MKRRKRWISTLALILVLLLLAGCSSAPSTSSGSSSQNSDGSSSASGETSQEPMLMRYYMPGAPTQDADTATAAINEKLAADGVPVIFTPMYIPWDQWTNKINLMLSANDKFELLHVMDDYVPLYSYVSRDGLMPLDDLIDQYTPELWDLFDDQLWQCSSVNGQVFAIPDYWRDNSGDSEGRMNFRLDKFEEFGLELPTTLDEVLEVLPVLQEKWAEQDGETRYVYEHSIDRTPIAFQRTYDTWPFFVSQDGIFCARQDGTAEMYFTTEEFKKDCEFMHEMYTMGLTHPDILNLPADTRRTSLDYGDYLMGIQTGGTTTTLIANGVENAEIVSAPLSPDKPFLTSLPLINANSVPATAENPEAALLFLNWMYSSKENQDLVLYGVKEVHWNPVGEDEFERINGEDGKPLYAFDSWMIEYVPYHRFDVNDVSTEEERLDYVSNIYPDNTIESVVVGFSFDPTSVSVEYANVKSEYTTSMIPIKCGVVSYEEGYADALEAMKAAGYEAVIEEYQRQLTEYLENKE